MTVDSSRVYLSTGKRICANNGILAVSSNIGWRENTNTVVFTEGYDCHVLTEDESGLTKEERQEIADYYINLWKLWVNQ